MSFIKALTLCSLIAVFGMGITSCARENGPTGGAAEESKYERDKQKQTCPYSNNRKTTEPPSDQGQLGESPQTVGDEEGAGGNGGGNGIGMNQ